MTFEPSFYRAAAVCSALSAITTLLLILLPELYAPVEGFDGRMRRVTDPAYVVRSWVYLVHPFLVMTAALAVAMHIRRSHPAAALIGMLGFVMWGFTEAGQQTLTVFAFDRWRTAWLAGDELVRAHIQTSSAIYDGLWDAMYFLLLLGFAIGNAAFGIALMKGRGLTRIVGGFFLAAFALTFTIIAGELRWFTLPEPLSGWLYPLIQPLGRLLIGLELWRAAEDRVLGTSDVPR
ncbi:MAG: hypothetical protein ACREV5_04975 [Steroidobacter sp.]